MNKQNDIQLSEHFSLSEFTKSITAERLGIDNKPGYEQVLAMRNLCREVLEPLRQHYGQPIRITSGYRCEELNSAVGGVRRSQHMLGEAADLATGSSGSSATRTSTRCSSSTAVACATAGCTSPAGGTVSATATRLSLTTEYSPPPSPPKREGSLETVVIQLVRAQDSCSSTPYTANTRLY